MADFKFEISNLKSSPAKVAALCLLLAASCLPGPPARAAAASWSRQQSGTFAWLHAVYFLDGRRGWAAGGKGALLSTDDGGATWRRRASPTEDTLRDLFFVDGEYGWAVCERDIFKLRTKEEHRSYLLKTEDGGASWRRVEVAGADVDARLVGVRFAGREHGWAFGEMGALYATADGGRTWSPQRVPVKRLILAGAFLDQSRGWLVGAGASALYTEDGGATWREGGGAIPAGARLNAVSFVDARRGWAVGAGGLVLSTADGGRTWGAQQSGVESDLYDVKFFDAREGWAVGGEGAVLHTTDGGATWRAEPPVTPHTLERLFFAGRARGWAVGFGGTIIAFGEQR
jgi:photosystem II stability/assembly factor-like uncharacterized protein